MSAFSSPVLPTGRVSVKSYGAKGDGATDDRLAIAAAATSAQTLGSSLFFPAGTYLLSKYAYLESLSKLKIYGETSAIIRFPSDDVAVVADGTVASDEMARSAFVLRNCSNVTIQGLNGLGGDNTSLDLNRGSFVYANKCVGITLRDCVVTNGYALFVQDADTGTTGTGDSLAVAAGVMTLTDAAGSFVGGHVGRQITIAGATNETNNGAFEIASVVSSTVITFLNPDGVAETSSLRWAIDNNDRGTRIESCHSFNQRGPMRTGNDAVIRDCLFERPSSTLDLCGWGDSLAISGTTVTLTDAAARFLPSHVGKYIKIDGATSGGNEGLFKITALTSSSKVTFTNASGVTERFDGTWWIANGDKVGVGAGGAALAKSGDTMTLTSSTSAFTANDVNKIVRIAGATTTGNNQQYRITGYVGPTQITYENTGGASETFSGVWSIDAFDRAGPSSDPYGSSHGIYIFAGRNNIKVDGCTFKGIRTTCVKASGSALPIRNITITNNTAIECAEFCQLGADDSQEHTGFLVANNTLIDVGTQRAGATSARGISILGTRAVRIHGNLFHFTRDAIGTVSGDLISGISLIHVSRYTRGVSQPVEDVEISHNKFTVDPATTSRGGAASFAIQAIDVGARAKYRTGGTLTKSGDVMTLTDGSSDFHYSDVGKSITLLNCADAGNDGTFVIETANSAVLTFTNASGVGSGAAVGTYRIPDHVGRRSGGLQISHNYFDSVANNAIRCERCLAPDIVFNTIINGTINLTGDCTPRIAFNRWVGTYTLNAHIRLASGTSWPIVHDNFVTNQGLGGVSGRDAAIGISATSVDYPLLGKRGRVAPTQAKQQIVVSYGAGHVDGDTITVTGTTYTYKASGPAGNQFNSMAGLIALINAQADHDCVEYGTHLTPSVATGHLLISADTAGDTDGEITVAVSALLPTALVLLRNDATTNQTCEGRGAGSSGPTADKTVIWSPLCTYAGGAQIWADEATAQALIVSDGWRPIKSLTDGGACEVITHGTSAGTEEFRWSIA